MPFTCGISACILLRLLFHEESLESYLQTGCGQCRSPHLWKDPDTFRPERFSETNTNPAFEGRWAGYRPEAQGSSLYPNEVAADFAFIPFGGGARKCVGDQFALLEATVALAMLLR